ncbi:Oxysterol-binding protein-related protein 11 [Armadillidium vulgare]|nr:Oxysterol-binding protein-related protein 11 [Armadillidium vulgare]
MIMDDKLRQPYQGHLIKFTNVVKGWQSRWFILDPERGSLEYYLSEGGDKYEKARGSILLAGAVISPSDEDSLTFTVSPAVGESYKLRAHDTRDRQMWINRLRIIAEMHTRAIAHHHPPLAPREHRIRENTSSHSHLSGFGGGLDVIDAFTQVAEILEESQRQHSALAQSIEELPSHGPGIKCIEPNILLIKATSQATILCLDQCLSALRSRHSALQFNANHSKQSSQFSKSLISFSPLVSPLMGRSPRSRRRHTADLTGDVNQRRSSPGYKHHSSSPHRSIPSNKSKTAPQSPALPILPSTLPVKAQRTSSSPTPSGISETSSTSSTLGKLTSITPQSNLEKTLPKSFAIPSAGSVVKGNNVPREIDSEDVSDSDDVLNLSDDEERLPVEEGQKSVIMHIISQLRLGMDLTRVTLPTFILEKRSLLEMFADFLGHPDLFLKISACSSPEERILAVAKWYLTSIHVGRHGSVAKKPYNPIIGEVFYCSWRVPVNVVEENTDNESDSQNFYTIRYSSEQVSHHPPEKEMCVNAHIWTKSKFLGMSVGVNLIGNISLYLGKFSETYHLAMPSAYARSVLMEPWVELGGRVNIYCPQSGYSAPIVFHTKVIDIKNLGLVCRKRVRLLEKQEENESRRLWIDVSKALARECLETATNHKKALEDKQRFEEQRRKESNTSFQTKLFTPSGNDQWVYKDLPNYAKNLLSSSQQSVT